MGIILMPACCTPESLGPKNWASVGALLLFAQAVNKKIPAAAMVICRSFFKCMIYIMNVHKKPIHF
jgi:hypothetical protein